MAHRFSAEGLAIVVADVNGEAAEAVSAVIRAEGGRAVARRVDVGDPHQVRAVIADVASRGRLDIMVNNAGVALGGEAHRVTDEDWKTVMRIDFEGVLAGTLAAYAVMRKQGLGHIVNTASATGLMPQPGNAPYCAAKHAVVGLSRSLRHEAAAYGVRVSVICPGRVRTRITTHMRVAGADNHAVAQATAGSWMPAEKAADIIWRGMSANREIILFPSALRGVRLLDAASPRLTAPLWRGMISRLRSVTELDADKSHSQPDPGTR